MQEKKHHCHTSCMLSDAWIRALSWALESFGEKLLFLKNYVTSEGVVSHNVLYYKQLSNASYKVSF